MIKFPSRTNVEEGEAANKGKVKSASANGHLELVESKVDGDRPLKLFLESFKEKYNISVEADDIAIFV